ncbi:MAG: Pyruvate synthase subunit PorA [Promethearchaeota archaeon]|nr:MAG: Pyruvate synthase subunit PorA [Candidatus Lokiarchaeota archaeon]
MTEAEKKDFFQNKETKIIKGNVSAAYAAKSARVQVISAYPITPQTTVVEKLSEFVDGGLMPGTQYIKVESEHSVMASIVGASIAGTRTFTATSGQGLFYMNEMIHWAAGARLPVVTAIASRGPAPPWNIWADYFDIINARDTGWMSAVVADHQEIYDDILMSYKICEDEDVLLPKFVAYGGFVLSHTSKPVVVEDQKVVDEFLPSLPGEEGWPHIFIDPDRPMTHGNLIMPEGYYMEYRMKIHDAMIKAQQKIKEVAKEFEEKFGRSYGNGLIEEYKLEDADVALLNYGGLALQAEQAVDELREEGYKVGCVKLRYIRPFPTEEILKVSKKVEVLGVVDRGTAFGSPTGGPVSSEVKTALHNQDVSTTILPIITGLGGREVSVSNQKDQLKILMKIKETGEMPSDLLYGTLWHGKREVK